jgi:flagellar hook-length control protein FliK
MTASVPVTASNVAAAAGSRPGATAAPRDGTGTPAGFDSQLHAARQQRDTGSANGASNGQDSRTHMSAARPPLDPPLESAPPADPGAVPASLPAAPATALAAEAVVPAAGELAVKADKNEPDDQPASAMAGAMLVLLGSSAAGVLQPAPGAAGVVAGALAQAGKTVAGDARAAAMLQLGAAGSPPVAAPVNTLPAAASMLAMAHAALPASAAADKDSSEGRGLAAALSAPSAAAAAPVAVHQLQLQSPPGGPSFAQDLGQQVAWLGGQNIKQARIRLHPEELGSLDVSVSVTQGRVDVVFNAQHPAAVSAVQQSLPQLDQMLARHGLSLGHAEVGQHDRGDRRGHAGDGGTAAVDEIGEVHGGMPVSLGKVGLLDAFA